MTAPSVPTPLQSPKSAPSGFQTALRYTGIPTSWLNKRPKLPSRNWLIFLSVVFSTTGLYIYDRRQCKRIKQHYIDLVKDQADELVSPLDWPRRVTVYASKWPGDEDYNQPMRYFRKYVKPIFVAAAVDFETITGKRHGDIAHRVASDVRLRRRLALGIDSETAEEKVLPMYKSPEEAWQRELDGGIVIVGRPTFKEFMAGLKKGWTNGLENVDEEEQLARELELDGRFDEPEDEDDSSEGQRRLMASETTLTPFGRPFTSLPGPFPSSRDDSQSSIANAMDSPSVVIPPIPPLLLVPYIDYIGFKQIPFMIWDFFNQRDKVLAGAEAAYRLIMKHSRPLIPPTEKRDAPNDIATFSETGDLNFDRGAESWYKKSVFSIPEDIETGRKTFYEALPAKLATARALARGTRDPTKDEKLNPPPTEVELRAERMNKERKWRRDLEGWEIVNPKTEVAWDDRLDESLRIFIDPPSSVDRN